MRASPIARGNYSGSSGGMHLEESKALILIAEDGENDALMLKRAIDKSGLKMPVYICADGEIAMQYLRGLGEFSNREQFPFPRMIVTDLKMPRCGGFEILEWLQKHPECNLIPKIVLSARFDHFLLAGALFLGSSTANQVRLQGRSRQIQWAQPA